MDYELKLKELEDILKEMESSDVTLKQMMENYKKALDLYSELENYLSDYKQEIKKITSNGPVDFNEEDIEEASDHE